MINKDISKILSNYDNRILALEEALKKTKTERLIKKDIKQENHSGPKGGILFLFNQGVFKKKNTADEIKTKLEKEGYIYKREVVQTALNRLSKSKGLLVKIEEESKKVYVQRK